MGSAFKCFLLTLATWALVSDATRFRCDYVYNPDSRAWYKYHEIPATWNDARLMCTLEGGILASPTTPQLRDAMKKSLSDAGTLQIFTGLRSTFSKGSFYTVNVTLMMILSVSSHYVNASYPRPWKVLYYPKRTMFKKADLIDKGCVVFIKDCPKIYKRRVVCARHYDGSFQTFNNYCEMEFENCNGWRKWSLVKQDRC